MKSETHTHTKRAALLYNWRKRGKEKQTSASRNADKKMMGTKNNANEKEREFTCANKK